MSHALEMLSGKAQMAYAGHTPWHGLGTKVSNDLSAHEMLVAANLDWEVLKAPQYYQHGGGIKTSDKLALIRSTDGRQFSDVSQDWNPVQNQQLAEFFHDFVKDGDMEMNTAGALYDGNTVWMLARVKESFALFNGKDEVESYMLFSNPHQYGKRVDIRLTPTRVVCHNTLTLALAGKTDLEVKLNHSRKFDAAKVKETMGIAHNRLHDYQEAAEFLASKRFNKDQLVEYFDVVFPVSGKAVEKKTSHAAKLALAAMDTQPGAKLGEGTWWQPFNAVTFAIDHVLGREPETRLASAWYGPNRVKKVKALELATEMAKAS